MHKLHLILFLIYITGVWSCSANKEERRQQTKKSFHTDQDEPLIIEHAENFNVEFHDGYKKVTVSNPWKNADRRFTYLLVQKGDDPPKGITADQVVFIPIEEMVCFSTTHIPLLTYLNESDKLTGFPNPDYISAPELRRRVDAGKVANLGPEIDINVETLISLNPEVVMAYSTNAQSDQLEKVRRTGIPVILNADYMENTPLGRAEWIKFMSLFFNKEAMADSVFNEIRKNYDSLRKLVKGVAERPTVFSGIVYGDAWFMPGGENYAAKFFTHAGSDYLWSENKQTGYLEIAFEAVYARASDADFWIAVGNYKTLDELAQADSRYRNFKAFQEGNVYNYNARIGPKGGNEYFELGYLRPDLILGDLISIFHEDRAPDHELYFHQKLK